MTFKIIPVILAGGNGTRLWPLSRETFPKQFLRLVTQYSLLQETILRVEALSEKCHPLIVCTVDHYFMSQDHLREIDATGYHFILEPFGRNTAPAIACAAQWVLQNLSEETILLILPSDHYIAEINSFVDAVNKAKIAAEQDYLVTFGVTPNSPETGYGYIQAGAVLHENIYHVERFIEKPNLALAKKFLESSHFFWNSGMFMFKPQVYLQELKKSAMDVYEIATQCIDKGETKEDYFRIKNDIYSNCPSISIDYALMEKTQRAVTIPLETAWNDLGCWNAVAKAAAPDNENNVTRGEVLIKDSNDCYISSESQMVAALGISNQIIVTTPDVVLVADKAYSQDVKNLVNQLKIDNNQLVAKHKRQFAPWGTIESISDQDLFLIERFIIKPLSILAMPRSIYSEFWIMVEGEVEMLANQQLHVLKGHRSIYIGENTIIEFNNKRAQAVQLIRIRIKSLLDLENKNALNEESSTV
ncbi:MAG: mannose-1-phosphate guanylyltransferase/mannose-6-phosphate isomerase [Proteobacteria bacterium]|nr:mannose-1-phosphate guanylyltransferase/mannose-6-phosphate isomerase [Pseudomonadota bacterium]